MLKITKETLNYGVPVWQTVLETAQGGFTLTEPTAKGTTIPAGTPIGYDEATRIAKIAKVAVATAPAADNATSYQVKKGSPIKVGDTVKSGASGEQNVTAIDTSNADHDTITVGATLGVAVAAGDAIFVDDAGYQNVKGLSFADVDVPEDGQIGVSVVLRGTVYERRIGGVPDTMKAKLPLIIFSQSF
jgi:hypothetical protein